MNADQNSLNISYRQYRENKFVIGVSFEKMADVNFTGTNTKMGSLITFKIKATEGTLAETEQIQEIFTHLVSESVVELTESGAIVFDQSISKIHQYILKMYQKKKHTSTNDRKHEQTSIG